MYRGHIQAASNRADLKFQIELIDPSTGDFVDYTGATITIALRPISQQALRQGGTALTGTNLDGHITVIGLGTFEVHFTRTEMTRFIAGDVEIGVTVLLADGITHQLVAGQLPIIDGVVAA